MRKLLNLFKPDNYRPVWAKLIEHLDDPLVDKPTKCYRLLVISYSVARNGFKKTESRDYYSLDLADAHLKATWVLIELHAADLDANTKSPSHVFPADTIEYLLKSGNQIINELKFNKNTTHGPSTL